MNAFGEDGSTSHRSSAATTVSGRTGTHPDAYPARMGGAFEADVPNAHTGRAKKLSRHGAKLTGTLDPNGLATQYRFEYGKTSHYGRKTVLDCIALNLDRSERRLREKIAALPDGEYVYEDYLEFYEEGRFDPVLMRLTLTVRGDEIIADFAGSNAQVPGVVNSSLATTGAGVFVAIKSALDPEGPINHGVFRAIRLLAPEASIVDLRGDAPAGAHGLPTAPTTHAAATPEEVAEQVAQATEVAHVLGREREAARARAGSTGAEATGTEAPGHRAETADLVVGRALLVVGEDVVGGGDLLERLLVAGVGVGVMLLGQLPVGAPDLLVGGRLRHTEDLVVILLEPLALGLRGHGVIP